MPSTCKRRISRAGKHGKKPRRNVVTAAQFREARKGAGFTREQAAEFLSVSLRTIGQWETGTHRPSWAAFKLLRIYRNGDFLHPDWSGYSIIRGKLVTPENHSFGPGDLSWLSLLVRRANAMSDLLQARDGRKNGAAATVARTDRTQAGREVSKAQAPSGACVGEGAGAKVGVILTGTVRTRVTSELAEARGNKATPPRKEGARFTGSIGTSLLPSSNRGVSGFRKGKSDSNGLSRARAAGGAK